MQCHRESLQHQQLSTLDIEREIVDGGVAECQQEGVERDTLGRHLIALPLTLTSHNNTRHLILLEARPSHPRLEFSVLDSAQ